MKQPYRPHRTLRGAHVQSIIGSSALRRQLVRRRAQAMLYATRREVRTVLDNVRLETWTSRPAQPVARAILFHGWEGSVDSNYVIELGGRLFGKNVEIVRVHFRDHGGTEALNKGIFHSCRLDEIVALTNQLVGQDDLPAFVAGFSLGGNFALRACCLVEKEVRHVYSVSPVISPHASLAAIESAPFVYQRYFMGKWLKSLKKKCDLFPDLYSWDDAYMRMDLRQLTSWLVERYTPFTCLDAYLDGYSVAGDRLLELRWPTTILTAQDDPVIPVADFHHLNLAENTQLIITDQGGHCSFVEDWRLASWATVAIAHHIEARLTSA